MRNFAIFLLLGNIAWWGWQFFPRREHSVKAKEIQHASFIQAEKKLLMLTEPPVELRTELAGDDKSVEVVPEQALLPATMTANTAAVQASVTSPASPIPWCGVTNSFSMPENAKKFQAEWLRLAGEADQELVKEPGSSTWWVYLPASKNEDATQLVLKQLHEKNIDSYYMRSGDLTGGISLGVFSRKGSAVNVQDSIRKKGYAAEVKEVLRMDAKVRIGLKLDDRTKLESPAVQQLLGKYDGAAVKEIACK